MMRIRSRSLVVEKKAKRVMRTKVAKEKMKTREVTRTQRMKRKTNPKRRMNTLPKREPMSCKQNPMKSHSKGLKN